MSLLKFPSVLRVLYLAESTAYTISFIGRKIICYGFGADCDVRAENITHTSDGERFELIAEGKLFAASLNIVGEHHVMNALAAFCVGRELGLMNHIPASHVSANAKQAIKTLVKVIIEELISFGFFQQFLPFSFQKQGTPTMGGIMFIIAVFVSFLCGMILLGAFGGADMNGTDRPELIRSAAGLVMAGVFGYRP